MWESLFDNYLLFLCIFARVAGMVLFNPIFGRTNLPGTAKMGFCLFLSTLLLGLSPSSSLAGVTNLAVFFVICAKEFLIGFFAGFTVQLFLSILILAGDFADLQLGVGMAKVYDPQSNVSMSLTGSLFNIFYMVAFFASGGHRTFIKMIFYSFEVLPAGLSGINPAGYEFGALLFGNILVLALKLAMPLIAVEIVAEMCLGALMRTVSQINVFAVGLQLKLLVGLGLIVLIFPVFFGFFDAMTGAMFDAVQKGFLLMR